MQSERVFIVILAYIIGFITAYIAFGISIDGPRAYDAIVQNRTNFSNERLSVGTAIKSDGLYALLGDNERILSAAVIDAKTETNVGFHENIVRTLVSEDGRYIYYCADTTKTTEQCESFIYDVADDVTRRVVSEDDSVILIKNSELYAEWLPNNVLVLNSYVSNSGDTPWEMLKK